MASQLKLKSNYLISFLIGSSSFLAFSPYDLKFILVLNFCYLVWIVKTEINYKFLNIFAWGFGYWLLGIFWLIVSIHYHGNVNIYLSLIFLVILTSALSLTFFSPLFIYQYLNVTRTKIIIVSIATLLILTEISRYFLLGGFPWFQSGLVFLDTILSPLISIIGVTGCSVIFFYIVTTAMSIKLNLRVPIIFTFCLLLTLPEVHKAKDLQSKTISVGIVQPSLDTNLKFDAEYVDTIETRLITLTKKIKTADLIVWPEAPLPYLSPSIRSKKLEEMLKTENIRVLSGIYEYDGENLFNSMSFLPEYNQTHRKAKLVPFGEYVPFEPYLRGLIDFFDLPMSNMRPSTSNIERLTFMETSFLPLICFDAIFVNYYIKESKNSTFVINISNDSWFGNSYGPEQHLQIVRAKAKEINKWIIRATTNGISAFINNNGTIVDKIETGKSESKIYQVQLSNNSSIYVKYSYEMIFYLICIKVIFIIYLIILRFVF